tara:strand:+ start:1301 stop:3013 length:1713 start_codon:yes stop_codon:yes gene_type:complete
MRLSRSFGKTLREDPADADTDSHRLLIKAGFLGQVISGVFNYLPLAFRSLKKIEAIVREEMDNVGGQELFLSTLQPEDLWIKSGRLSAFGPTLFRLKDRRNRNLVLGPTHEEVITDLVKNHIQSYRDLPVTLYQIQTKLRDEARPRAGLIRVREFAMKDAYSFHSTQDDLDKHYEELVKAYHNIFRRCGLDVIAVEADSGAIGGKDSQEFILLTDTGEDEIIICDSCNYAANIEKAESILEFDQNDQILESRTEISTPNISSIDHLSNFLDTPKSNILKTVVYITEGQLILVAIRGDLTVNEVKLSNYLNSSDLRIASDEEMVDKGLEKGFISPVGLDKFRVVGDTSIVPVSNFIAGANKTDAHYKNVNFPIDFEVDEIIDLNRVQAGQDCIKCGSQLKIQRGIEVGHVFKLGTTFTEPMEAFFLDNDGVKKPVLMGCYGIGIGRLLGAAIESHNDSKGIIFPQTISPADVILIGLNQNDDTVLLATESLYSDLVNNNVDILYDDRSETAGVKFSDADLIGIPVRITVSSRTLKNGNSVELKYREDDNEKAVNLPLSDIDKIKEMIYRQG